MTDLENIKYGFKAILGKIQKAREDFENGDIVDLDIIESDLVKNIDLINSSKKNELAHFSEDFAHISKEMKQLTIQFGENIKEIENKIKKINSHQIANSKYNQSL